MKFSATRRGVLALLGAAPAAPLMAKAVIEKEMAALSGVNLGAAYGIGLPNGPPCVEASSEPDSLSLAGEYLDLFGLPSHIEDQFFRQSRNISSIDPDLLAKRTWSWSVKVLTQRERNLQNMRRQVKDGIARNRTEKAFRKIAGFNWPFYY